MNPPASTDRPPHQQRVIDEKSDLDDRLSKLGVFIRDNPLFPQLPEDEQDRLQHQSLVMSEYSEILAARIAAFPPVTP